MQTTCITIIHNKSDRRHKPIGLEKLFGFADVSGKRLLERKVLLAARRIWQSTESLPKFTKTESNPKVNSK